MQNATVSIMQKQHLFIIRSMASLGFAPNQKLAAPLSCFCFSVPEQPAAAAAAGGKSLGCCVSATGYYWASLPLCVFVPVSER